MLVFDNGGNGLSQVSRGGSEVWWKMAGIPFYSCRGWCGGGWTDGKAAHILPGTHCFLPVMAESPQLTVAGAVCKVRAASRGVKGFQ